MSKRIVASAKNMVSLFWSDTGLEVLPEPFRLRKDMYVSIPYNEFRTFVTKYDMPSYLPALDFPSIRKKMNSNPKSLYSYYMMYMALAQYKEISFLARPDCVNAKYMTKYLATSVNVQHMSLNDILDKSSAINPKTMNLINSLRAVGLTIDPYNLSNPDVVKALKLASFYHGQASASKSGEQNYFTIDID